MKKITQNKDKVIVLTQPLQIDDKEIKELVIIDPKLGLFTKELLDCITSRQPNGDEMKQIFLVMIQPKLNLAQLNEISLPDFSNGWRCILTKMQELQWQKSDKVIVLTQPLQLDGTKIKKLVLTEPKLGLLPSDLLDRFMSGIPDSDDIKQILLLMIKPKLNLAQLNEISFYDYLRTQGYLTAILTENC